MKFAREYYFIRHAKTESFKGIYGALDVPIGAVEHEKIRELADIVPHGALWVSSLLKRCIQTAELIRERLGETGEVQILNELAEQNFGEFEGLAKEKLETKPPTPYWLFRRDFRPLRGESFDDLVERATAVLRSLDSFESNLIVALTHGNFLRALLASILDLKSDVPSKIEIMNLSIVHIGRTKEGRIHLVL